MKRRHFLLVGGPIHHNMGDLLLRTSSCTSTCGLSSKVSSSRFTPLIGPGIVGVTIRQRKKAVKIAFGYIFKCGRSCRVTQIEKKRNAIQQGQGYSNIYVLYVLSTCHVHAIFSTYFDQPIIPPVVLDWIKTQTSLGRLSRKSYL